MFGRFKRKPLQEKVVPTNPALVWFRSEGSTSAIVFVHGFTGDAKKTWTDFSSLIANDPTMNGWDVVGFEYPSRHRIDIPSVWTADPTLKLLALQFSTTMRISLPKCRSIAIVAHSMGGLFVQRALLDDTELLARTRHLLLYGTPSAGILKANWLSRLKRQIRDMVPKNDFVASLRKDWDAAFKITRPFNLRVVAGNEDEFVPPQSSIEPFPIENCAAVPGNHTSIVGPRDPASPSYQIFSEALNYQAMRPGIVDTARLATELGEYQRAIDGLWPNRHDLDDDGICTLALALDGVGRGPAALQLLDDFHKNGHTSSTEARSVLGGRIKRRWLSSRNRADLERSQALYAEALAMAEGRTGGPDHAQAYYAAINLAFLHFMASPRNSAPSEKVSNFATLALSHAQLAPPEPWIPATEAEALLLLGRFPEALQKYREAILRSQSLRGRQSMYAQAYHILSRKGDEQALTELDRLFDELRAA